jgi:Flp pilus assembly protein TadG
MARTRSTLLQRMRKRVRPSFIKDERAATLVEFALLAVPFFGIVGAILQTAVIFLAGQILDSGLQDVSRLIRTGQALGLSGSTATDRFKTRVCERLYGIFPNCEDELFVDVRVVGLFQSATVSPPVDLTCTRNCDWTRTETFQGSGSSDVILVQAYYKWPVILDFAGFTMANLPEGKRLLAAATVFRNEPF